MIKRWRMALKYNNMVENAEGGWVAWEDHVKSIAEAQAQIDALEQRLAGIEERAKPWVPMRKGWKWKTESPAR